MELAAAARARSGATGYELARAVGRNSAGAVQDPLDTLVRYGVLARRPARRGRRHVSLLHFDTSWAAALDSALAIQRAPAVGTLLAAAQIVLVGADELAALATALDDQQTRACVAWLAELADSSLGALVAVAPDADGRDVTRLLGALRRAGARVGERTVRASVARTLSRDELPQWTRDVHGEPDTPALGP